MYVLKTVSVIVKQVSGRWRRLCEESSWDYYAYFDGKMFWFLNVGNPLFFAAVNLLAGENHHQLGKLFFKFSELGKLRDLLVLVCFACWCWFSVVDPYEKLKRFATGLIRYDATVILFTRKNRFYKQRGGWSYKGGWPHLLRQFLAFLSLSTGIGAAPVCFLLHARAPVPWSASFSLSFSQNPFSLAPIKLFAPLFPAQLSVKAGAGVEAERRSLLVSSASAQWFFSTWFLKNPFGELFRPFLQVGLCTGSRNSVEKCELR